MVDFPKREYPELCGQRGGQTTSHAMCQLGDLQEAEELPPGAVLDVAGSETVVENMFEPQGVTFAWSRRTEAKTPT